MSRYRDDPRYSGGDLAYRDAPTQRWDTDRFARERDHRGPSMGGRPSYDDYRSPPRAAAPVYERERYYEDDRYGPRGQRSERRFFEEEDYYRDDPRAGGGAMIPFRPERPARPRPPVRPGQLIRRQSSLDTFDRKPARRYDDYDDRRGPPPGRGSRPGFNETVFDEVKIQDPEYYGDDGFREYREREWVRRRRRSNSSSRSRSRDRRAEFVEEIKEEKIESGEKPYPRRGKTRMPRRLVHTKVLYDLGYPFYEEDEKTILIEKALGPENIDQVFTMSKEYRERETTTTRLLEAPPLEPIIVPPPRSVREEIIEKDEVRTLPISEAPRSVREWDHLSVRSPSPKSRKSHRSRSRRRSRRGSSPGTMVRETFVEKKVVDRDYSPARTHRNSIRDLSPAHTHRTRRSHSSHSGSETIIEKTKIISDEEIGESNSVHVGPLALVVDRHPSRSDRDIKDEIRRLEVERRALRRERRYERESDEVIKIERVRDRSPSPRGEIVIERRGEEIVEVKKDRRERARSVAPSPGIIKAMMATLT